MHRVKAIVFDVSGVLRDSRVALNQCFIDAFRKHGIEGLNLEQMWHIRGLESFNNLLNATKLLYYTKGRGLEDVLSLPLSQAEAKLMKMMEDSIEIQDGLSLSERNTRIKDIRDEFRTLFASPEAGSGVVLMEGVEEGLKNLRQSGYRLSVLSNSTLAALNRDIGHLYPYFDLPPIAEAEKPNVTQYLKTLSELGLQPHEVAYVGDAVSDIVMARNAGSPSIALMSGMGLKAHLEEANPKYIFHNFHEFAQYAVKDGIIENQVSSN
eukprot:TRINITY_DN12773_c0_g1_i1.p1 TRINITY_DN12773_c0_g1~~TRINITY_DN12773_c0_g1_i1.p1  ORF type:complete len:266 (-),score=69.20 TRINITY_DN12773_c0_g1_i1:109-906(-)